LSACGRACGAGVFVVAVLAASADTYAVTLQEQNAAMLQKLQRVHDLSDAQMTEVREIFRCWEGRPGLSGLDVVVHLKPPAGRAGFRELKAEVEELFCQLTAGGSGGRRKEGP